MPLCGRLLLLTFFVNKPHVLTNTANWYNIFKQTYLGCIVIV